MYREITVFRILQIAPSNQDSFTDPISIMIRTCYELELCENNDYIQIMLVWPRKSGKSVLGKCYSREGEVEMELYVCSVGQHGNLSWDNEKAYTMVWVAFCTTMCTPSHLLAMGREQWCMCGEKLSNKYCIMLLQCEVFRVYLGQFKIKD